MSSRHAFRRLDIPPQSWPAPGTARVGANPPEPHALRNRKPPKATGVPSACPRRWPVFDQIGGVRAEPPSPKQEPDTATQPPQATRNREPRNPTNLRNRRHRLSKLGGVKIKIPPPSTHQLNMGPTLNNLPVLQHQNLISSPNSRQPVRNDQRGPPRQRLSQSL